MTSWVGIGFRDFGGRATQQASYRRNARLSADHQRGGTRGCAFAWAVRAASFGDGGDDRYRRDGGATECGGGWWMDFMPCDSAEAINRSVTGCVAAIRRRKS